MDVLERGVISISNGQVFWKISEVSQLEEISTYRSKRFEVAGEEWYFEVTRYPISGMCCYSLYLKELHKISAVFSVRLGMVGVNCKSYFHTYSDSEREYSSFFNNQCRDDSGCDSETFFCEISRVSEPSTAALTDPVGTGLTVTVAPVTGAPQTLTSKSSNSKLDKEVQTEDFRILTDFELKSLDKLQADLKELLKQEKDSDAIMKVKSQDFKIHRLIVGMRCPVLEAMFEHDMLEKQTGVAKVEECDPETFPDFLEYIYTGRIELSSENALQLYKSADFFQMRLLKEECLKHMKTNLTVENFCDILSLSILHTEKNLTSIATDFFISNASDIVLSIKWQTFLTKNPTEANELFVKALLKNNNNNQKFSCSCFLKNSIETGEISTSDDSVFWTISKLPQPTDSTGYRSNAFQFADEEWYFEIPAPVINDGFGLYFHVLYLRKRKDCCSEFKVRLGIKGKTIDTSHKLDSRQKFCSLQFMDILWNPSSNITFLCDINKSPGRCGNSVQDEEVQTEDFRILTDFELKSVDKLQADLKELLSGEKDSDAILKVKSREFKVHRLIVGLRCPFLEAMFEHDMSEKQTEIAKVEDCDPETFPDFLEYIYTGKVQLSSENALQLYKSADFFQMILLKKECLKHMKTNLTVENFCDILTLSLLHTERELTRVATDFFISKASDIVLSAKWQTFLIRHPIEANELFVKALLESKNISQQ